MIPSSQIRVDVWGKPRGDGFVPDHALYDVFVPIKYGTKWANAAMSMLCNASYHCESMISETEICITATVYRRESLFDLYQIKQTIMAALNGNPCPLPRRPTGLVFIMVGASIDEIVEMRTEWNQSNY